MSPGSVLVVDDEVEFTTALAKVLRRRGFEVTVAGGGDEALAAIDVGRFDAVVLDVKMPGRDGLTVLGEIKRRAPETEVILLTGHRSLVDEEDGLRTGASAYLLKPHPVVDLVARIEEAVARCRAARGDGGG